jgi:hypothetical protein
MKHYIIYIVLAVLFSCGISNRSRKAVETAFYSRIITQRAMAMILVESTEAIFQIDSLDPVNATFIHSLTALYVGKVDSFELRIDSIRAQWINDTIISFNKVKIVGDSVILKQVSVPGYNYYLIDDTLDIAVKCIYALGRKNTNKNNDLKCLTADYIVIGQSITVKNNFKKCCVNPTR